MGAFGPVPIAFYDAGTANANLTLFAIGDGVAVGIAQDTSRCSHGSPICNALVSGEGKYESRQRPGRDGAGVQLFTRNGNDFESRFPLIVEAIKALPVRSSATWNLRRRG